MDIQPASGLDPAARAGYSDHPPRMGFFTDTSVCIGCKACEVACKEWNAVPEDGLLLTGMSYDNTGGLSASTWRHVAFIEKPPADGGRDVRWLMSSDVCKHCTEAACLDVCPTGALMRTEFGTVVVQDDVCNGCGYCVSACPFGVIARRESDGGAHKCTLCYDWIGDGLVPGHAAERGRDRDGGGALQHAEAPLAKPGVAGYGQPQRRGQRRGGRYGALQVAGVYRADRAAAQLVRDIPRLAGAARRQPRLVGLTLSQAEGVPGALAVPDEPENRAAGCGQAVPARGRRNCGEAHDTQRAAGL